MGFHSFTRELPCPICGKPDWCGYSDNYIISKQIYYPTPTQTHENLFSAYLSVRIRLFNKNILKGERFL